jgi:hypothetical protein
VIGGHYLHKEKKNGNWNSDPRSNYSNSGRRLSHCDRENRIAINGVVRVSFVRAVKTVLMQCLDHGKRQTITQLARREKESSADKEERRLSFLTARLAPCRSWGSDSGTYEDFYLMGYNAV